MGIFLPRFWHISARCRFEERRFPELLALMLATLAMLRGARVKRDGVPEALRGQS